MVGLTAAGFERKRLPEIKEDIESALKQAFGNDIDLRAESVFGQIVGVLSLPIAELWEEAENVYLSFDPDFAEGVSMDGLAALTGVTRIPASQTTVNAAITGTSGTVVPAGSQARNSQTGDVYAIETNTTITPTSLLRSVIGLNTITDATTYTVTINSVPYSIVSPTGSTANAILQELAVEIEDGYAPVTVSIVGNEMTLLSDDGETTYSASLTSNLKFNKIASLASFIAVAAGQKFVPIGILSEIQTPVAGWESITNYVEGFAGRNRESDDELRVRRRQSVSFPATATIDAVLSRLLQIPNVSDAVVIENNGTTTDGNALPRQHVWAIVRGGAETTIGDVLYRTVAGGIGLYGDETVVVTSDSGQQYDIKFDRPEEVDLYIELEILVTKDFPTNGYDQIKAAIVEWVNTNIGIGDKLQYSRLYTPINSIQGFEVLDMDVGATAAPSGEVSLTVAPNQIIIADASRISIVEGS